MATDTEREIVAADHIIPPILESFNDKLWQEASPHLYAHIAELLEYDELRDLPGIPYELVWRKNGRPTVNGYPVFAEVTLTPPIELWRAQREERSAHPHYTLHLLWQHFDALREEGSFVTVPVLQRAAHHALMQLEVGESGALSKRPASLRVFPETVGRFGEYDQGIVSLRRQLELFEGRRDGAA